jgi:hypothetical protein
METTGVREFALGCYWEWEEGSLETLDISILGVDRLEELLDKGRKTSLEVERRQWETGFVDYIFVNPR